MTPTVVISDFFKSLYFNIYRFRKISNTIHTALFISNVLNAGIVFHTEQI